MSVHKSDVTRWASAESLVSSALLSKASLMSLSRKNAAEVRCVLSKLMLEYSQAKLRYPGFTEAYAADISFRLHRTLWLARVEKSDDHLVPLIEAHVSLFFSVLKATLRVMQDDFLFLFAWYGDLSWAKEHRTLLQAVDGQFPSASCTAKIDADNGLKQLFLPTKHPVTWWNLSRDLIDDSRNHGVTEPIFARYLEPASSQIWANFNIFLSSGIRQVRQ